MSVKIVKKNISNIHFGKINLENKTVDAIIFDWSANINGDNCKGNGYITAADNNKFEAGLCSDSFTNYFDGFDFEDIDEIKRKILEFIGSFRLDSKIGFERLAEVKK